MLICIIYSPFVLLISLRRDRRFRLINDVLILLYKARAQLSTFDLVRFYLSHVKYVYGIHMDSVLP